MLKIDTAALDRMEQQHPGIREEVRLREEAVLPACSRCGSANTAKVECGIIGRTICLSSATTKFKLIPNPPMPGRYFCNECEEFFG